MASQSFDWITGLLTTGFGLAGRMSYLIEERRSAFTLSLIWEIPTAIGMGFLGYGIGQYFNVNGSLCLGMAFLASFMGPKVASKYVPLPRSLITRVRK